MTKVVQNSRRGNGTGAGRTKGTPNKSTAQAREAIALLMEGNLTKMQGWLDRIAEQDPKAAIDTLVKLMEYHVPKLARMELAAETEDQVIREIEIRFVDAAATRIKELSGDLGRVEHGL